MYFPSVGPLARGRDEDLEHGWMCAGFFVESQLSLRTLFFSLPTAATLDLNDLEKVTLRL